MNTEKIRLIVRLLLIAGLATFAVLPVMAQVPVDENGNPIASLEEDGDELPALSAAELEDIIGPVALYPDDLLAIVLPASTYPLQVVQAARFLERFETDSSLKPDEEWDESITALLNYPEVVQLMNEDIDWTWRLGEAVVAQQADVIAAIETFRDRAYAAGNLKSDERQTVSNEDGVIEIEPVDEDVIYVPYYEPERVVVYQTRPVYHYYPHAYPVYYYPYPYGHSFGSAYFWGVTTAFTIGWLTDHLHVYHHSFWGHPYYGHYYHHHHYYRRSSLSHYNRFYVHNSRNHWNYRHRDGDYWRPGRHGGARPGDDRQRVHYYRDRSRDDWRHRAEDRVRVGSTDDRDRQRNSGARWASNRGDTDRQPGFRGREDSADRRDRNSTVSSDRDAITFRPRDARARTNPEDVVRTSDRRTGFAPSSRRTTTVANNRRSIPSRTTHPNTTARTTIERSGSASVSTPRRRVSQSPPRQTRAPSVQRTPARSQPQRSEPSRSATKESSGSDSRSSSRSSSGRSESRSRRRR